MVILEKSIRRQTLSLSMAIFFGILGCGVTNSRGGVAIEPPTPITVTVLPEGIFPVSAMDPTAIVITVGTAVQFHAVTPQGTRVDPLVIWRVRPHGAGPNPSLGTITQSGLFHAPDSASLLAIETLDVPGQAQAYRGGIFVEIKQ